MCDVVVLVRSLSPVRWFVISWVAVWQAPLPSTISLSLLKFTSIESMMLSNHLILCCPFSFCLQSFWASWSFLEGWLSTIWPKYWSFSFSISLSNEYLGLISIKIDWFDLFLSRWLSWVFFSTTIRKHQFFGAQFSLWTSSHICTVLS